MPVWSAVLGGVGQKATFPQITTSNNVDIHIYGRFDALTSGAFVSDGGTNSYFRYANNSLRFRAGSFLGNPKPYAPAIDTPLKITAKVRPTNVELFIDDVSIGSDNGTVNSMTINTAGFFASTLYLTFRLLRVVVDDFNTPANNLDLFNDVAAGASVTIPDKSGNGRDATLSGTPTDGSQWFLEGGAGNTADGTITLPPLAVSGSATDDSPGNTAAGTITLPPLAVSGSAADDSPGNTAAGTITLPPLAISGSNKEQDADFTIIIDVATKTIQTTSNTFTLRIQR